MDPQIQPRESPRPNPPGSGRLTHPRSARSVVREWQVGDSILDLYELKSILGEGGFGKVFRLYHRGWQMDLAVKTPNRKALERAGGTESFEREAETWVRLGLHPHTVSCYYVRRIDDIPRVFVEFLPGGDLHQLIRERRLYRGGPQASLKRILDIAIQFAWGLHHAHEHRLIHQDVKPANLMMTEDGVAKVTDFGLAHAKAVEMEAVEGNTMMVNGMGCTPQYAAPEQMNGQALTRRSDAWGWAASVLEMFQGERTWQVGTIAGYHLESLLESGPARPDLPAMPQSVAALLAECFREDERERPHDLGEIAARLVASYAHELGAPYPRASPRASQAMADTRNNQAISLLDLGRRDEALQAWDGALKGEPHHAESTYNRGLAAWRARELTDSALLKLMDEARGSTTSASDVAYLLAQVHLERGDCESGLQVLNSIRPPYDNRDDTRAAIELATRSLPLSRRCAASYDQGASVSAVALHDSCRFALSGADDGEIKVWDIVTGRCRRSLKDHREAVVALFISEQGEHAVSGSRDGRVNLWDLKSGAVVHSHDSERGAVRSLCLSRDGQHIISGGADLTPRIWPIGARHPTRSFSGHRSTVTAVRLTADSRHILSASLDKTLKLWRVKDGVCVRTLEGHDAGVTGAALAGEYVLSGSADGSVRLWSTKTGECLRAMAGHDGEVSTVCLAADGRSGITAGKDGALRLWDLPSGVCAHTFAGHEGAAMGVDQTADGRHAISGGRDRRVRLWTLHKRFEYRAPFVLSRVRSSEDLLSTQDAHENRLKAARESLARGNAQAALKSARKARLLPGFSKHGQSMALWRTLCAHFPHETLRDSWEDGALEGHTGAVRCLGLSLDARRAFSGSDDETLKVWNLERRQCTLTLPGHTAGVSALCARANGDFIIAGSGDGTLKLWSTQDSAPLASMKAHESAVSALSPSFDWRLALSGSTDGTLELWDLGSNQRLRSFSGHQKAVTACAMSPDARLAISAGEDRLIKFWDLPSGRCVGTAGAFDGHAGAIRAIVPSQDGRYVLSASDDGTLRLWSMGGERCLRTLGGSNSKVSSVALSRDAECALAGQSNGMLKLWRLSDGECLHEIEAHRGPVHCVCLGHNRSIGLSGSEAGELKLWALDWAIEEASSAPDWPEAVEGNLEVFLDQQIPWGVTLPAGQAPGKEEVTEALTRTGAAQWSEQDFQSLLESLHYAGYAWVPPARIRSRLDELAGVCAQAHANSHHATRPGACAQPGQGTPTDTPLVMIVSLEREVRAFSLRSLGAALVVLALSVWAASGLVHSFEESSALTETAALLERGASADAVDQEGNTLLFRAVRQGYVDVAEFLIGKGADVNSRNRLGWTPLHAAARSGELSLVKLLIAEGARLDVEAGLGQVIPIWIAEDAGHDDVVAALEKAMGIRWK